MPTSQVDLEGKSAVFAVWAFCMMGVTHSCSFLKVLCIQVTKNIEEEKHSKKWCQGGSLGALKLLALMKILTCVCLQCCFFFPLPSSLSLFLQNFQ